METDARPILAVALAICTLMGSQTTDAADPVKVHAAGSLRSVLADIAAEFTRRESTAVAFQFGPSGRLKDRLATGEVSDVFASADMEHPRALAEAGIAGSVRRFARNRLCGLASPKLAVNAATLLEVMLDDRVKLGTSTPKADPMGDYAWKLFERAESQHPGAFQQLSAKALQLTAGPQSPPPPKDRNVFGALVAGGSADLFLTYCTAALLAKNEEPQLAIIDIPEALNVIADYGLVVMKSAQPAAQRFADFVLSSDGQAILAKHGFAPGAGR